MRGAVGVSSSKQAVVCVQSGAAFNVVLLAWGPASPDFAVKTADAMTWDVFEFLLGGPVRADLRRGQTRDVGSEIAEMRRVDRQCCGLDWLEPVRAQSKTARAKISGPMSGATHVERHCRRSPVGGAQ